MHHRCTLAGLPASMAFRWRKSPCRPSLSQKNTASRGRMGQICGKSKKSEQARAGVWRTGGQCGQRERGVRLYRVARRRKNAQAPVPGGCQEGRDCCTETRLPAKWDAIAAPKPVWLPFGPPRLRPGSPGCQSQAPRNSFGGTDEGAGTQGARERPPAGLTRRKSRARRGSWG